MLKQTVTYEDFAGDQRTDDLYFNISKAELTEHLDLEAELTHVAQIFEGRDENFQLSVEEKKTVIAIIKKFMKLAYGVRSEDNKRFIKSEEIWEEFTQTAAYQSYFFSLFAEPNKALVFVEGILPKDFVELGKAQVDANQLALMEHPSMQGRRKAEAERPVIDTELPAGEDADFLEWKRQRELEAKLDRP